MTGVHLHTRCCACEAVPKSLIALEKSLEFLYHGACDGLHRAIVDALVPRETIPPSTGASYKNDQGKINVLKFSYEYEEIKNQVDVVVVGLISTEHTPCNLVRRYPAFSRKLFISRRFLPSFNPVCRDLVGHQTFTTKISRYLASVYVFSGNTICSDCHGKWPPCIRRTLLRTGVHIPYEQQRTTPSTPPPGSSARPTVGSPSFSSKDTFAVLCGSHSLCDSFGQCSSAVIVLRSTAVVVESANWHLLMHLRTAKARFSGRIQFLQHLYPALLVFKLTVHLTVAVVYPQHAPFGPCYAHPPSLGFSMLRLLRCVLCVCRPTFFSFF